MSHNRNPQRFRVWAEMLPRYAPLPCPCIHGAPEYEGERETSHSKSPAPPGWYEPRVQATVGTAGRGRSCARMAHPRPRADLLRGYAIPTGLRNGGERYEASRTPHWRREEQARGPTGGPRRPDAVARLCLHHADGWSAPGGWQGLIKRNALTGRWVVRVGLSRLLDSACFTLTRR